MDSSAVLCLSFSKMLYINQAHGFASDLLQIPMSIHALKDGRIRGAAVFLGEEERGGQEAVCCGKDGLQEGKPHQREGISPYPAGMHFCFHLPAGHRSSGAFHCPDPGHREVREMLPVQFRGMPLASNYRLLEKPFDFEKHMESMRKREHVHCHSHAS